MEDFYGSFYRHIKKVNLVNQLEMKLPFYNQRLENAIQVLANTEEKITKELKDKLATSSLDGIKPENSFSIPIAARRGSDGTATNQNKALHLPPND